ncbi:condensation domain-containing protein [Streptomyces sp. M19]
MAASAARRAGGRGADRLLARADRRPAVHRTPLDHPRPAEGRGAGANHNLLIGPELADRLDRLRRRTGGSLFTLVLTALSVVLNAWTGQRDLAVGTLVSGRTRPEFDRLIGYFVNVVPLRTRVEDGQSFRELWAATRASALESLAHQEMPYERLLELRRAHGGGDTPSGCCAWHSGPSRPWNCRGSRPNNSTSSWGRAVRPGGRGLGTGRRDQDLPPVRPGPVRRVHHRAARRATARRTRRVRTGPGPDRRPTAGRTGPRRARAADGRPAARQRPRGLRTAGRPHPGRHRADRRNALRELPRPGPRRRPAGRAAAGEGVADGDRVACCLPRSADAVLCVLGVLKAGAAYVALDPAQPAERLAEIVADARPRCVLTTTALLPAAPRWTAPGAPGGGRRNGRAGRTAPGTPRAPARPPGFGGLPRLHLRLDRPAEGRARHASRRAQPGPLDGAGPPATGAEVAAARTSPGSSTRCARPSARC